MKRRKRMRERGVFGLEVFYYAVNFAETAPDAYFFD
jgi:hypothetical protein